MIEHSVQILVRFKSYLDFVFYNISCLAYCTSEKINRKKVT